MQILLKNCAFVVTQNENREILRNKDVLIENGKISEIGENLDKTGEIIDCSEKILLPGLINTHTHLAMTLFRGYADDLALQKWLQKKIWPLEAKLTSDDCYAGNLLGCLEMMRSGTTCFNDMYFFGEEIKKAVETTGIRCFFSQTILDLPTMEFKDSQQAFDIFRKLSKQGSELFRVQIGTHAVYTCSKETLLKAKDLSEQYDIPIHIHLSETQKEVADCKREFGKTPVEHLNDMNFLKQEILAAHCVWLTEKDIRLMANNNVKVSHCPVSSMKLVSGVAPLKRMIDENIIVSLGTDSAASNNNLDLFEEMKTTALLHKLHNSDPTVLPAQKVLDLATIDGAKALGCVDEIGSVEPGKRADLILLDKNELQLVPNHNIVSNIVYSANGGNVDTVLVNGRIIMKNKRFLTLDKETIINNAQKTAEDLVRGL